MATFDEKKAVRLNEWRDWIKFFLTRKNDPDLATIEYAPELLNDYYWRIAKNYVKPLLKSTDHQEHNIHYYKIIAVSELTVMAITPLYFKNREDKKQKRAINAEFAFFVAISIMLAWRIEGNPIIEADALKKVYSYTEQIDVDKEYPQDFRLEHIEWLRGINPAAPLPILSNSQTWRMFFLAAKFYRNQ